MAGQSAGDGRRPQKAVVIEGEQGEEAGAVGLGIVGGGQEQTQEKRWGSASEKIEQAVVDEKKLGDDFHGRDVAYFSKFVKVTRGGGPLGDASFFDEADFHVGTLEEKLDEFLGKGAAGRFLFAFRDHGVGQGLDVLDALGGFLGGLADGFQQVEEPRLLGLLLGDFTQEAVIVAFSTEDAAAEEKHGLVEQAGKAEEKDEENAPGAAVAIVKRVDE